MKWLHMNEEIIHMKIICCNKIRELENLSSFLNKLNANGKIKWKKGARFSKIRRNYIQ